MTTVWSQLTSEWLKKDAEHYFSMYCINVPDALRVSFSIYCSCECLSAQSDADVRETALTRCWTRTLKPFQLGSSHQTTSRWPWWRGWHSSGCALRLAAGWSPSPSSWSARWSPTGPPTGRRSPCRWCQARCAPRGRCSGVRSCRAGRSRLLSEECPGCLLWRCSHHWLRGKSSSLGQPGNTCRGSWCPAGKLRGKLRESQCGSGVSINGKLLNFCLKYEIQSASPSWFYILHSLHTVAKHTFVDYWAVGQQHFLYCVHKHKNNLSVWCLWNCFCRQNTCL